MQKESARESYTNNKQAGGDVKKFWHVDLLGFSHAEENIQGLAVLRKLLRRPRTVVRGVELARKDTDIQINILCRHGEQKSISGREGGGGGV